MRKFLTVIIVLILSIGTILFWQKQKAVDFPDVNLMENMILKSSAFEHNSNIPSKYTCDGEDINPPLSVTNIPKDTKSLVLIVEDPDAPMGTFCHWTLWNISPEDTEILENSVPEGAVEGRTDFGRIGWGGPCPPSGAHRYFFKTYALDINLTLPIEASKTELQKAMEGHVLGGAELIGLYSRQ